MHASHLFARDYCVHGLSQQAGFGSLSCRLDLRRRLEIQSLCLCCGDIQKMTHAKRPVLFLLFFLSGFCGLVYQVVWTRLAFASFGIITPVLSVVLSVFMLGLSLGAWAGGSWIGGMAGKTRASAAYFYAGSEFIIGLGAFAVPKLFSLGERTLLAAGQSSSATYLLFSAVILSLSILPWCIFMGTTFPFMMAYVREREARGWESFSYLYLANVLGAMTGALVTALLLVEIFGFHNTLHLAAAANFTIAAISFWLGSEPQRAVAQERQPPPAVETVAAAAPPTGEEPKMVKWVLFTTGFVAMAMEVVWTREFTPVLKTQVYSFAMIVATYLGATFLGSWRYRQDLRGGKVRTTAEVLCWLSVSALLPVAVNDFRFISPDYWTELPHPVDALFVLGSICPFCALLGYLTPGLVDQFSVGGPKRAGSAYAINVLGCILGPLVAGYLLLPFLSERLALVLLATPFLGFHWYSSKRLPPLRRRALTLATAVMLCWSLFFARDFESYIRHLGKPYEVRRDYAASVISVGEGMNKQLLVNGIGMTKLTPITKFMAHFALAFQENRPESALIICFGMGTTYRAALSWDVQTTAVELVPSVKEAFPFYYADAAQHLANPEGRIITDDGRRYLERTQASFDAIVIDPPPPLNAAGSSLLYSKEFYHLAKSHLKPGGILQTWVPDNGSPTLRAALCSVAQSFRYVRCFHSIEGWGVHILGSMRPIPTCGADTLAARLPPKAKNDLLEWSHGAELPSYIARVLSREIPVSSIVDLTGQVPITDDLPYNEYFLLRDCGF
jgi:spermidine synthase